MTGRPPGRERRSADIQWTNASVLALAKDHDPVAVASERARNMALDAIDRGWKGPPFDPLALSVLLGIEVVANAEIRDARTVPIGKGRVRIEFNPTRPRGRLRYSVAHELAHTIFPDVADRVRNRARHDELTGDDWQLEALCNIVAAELLMPLGPLMSARVEPDDLTISDVLELQRRFDVSTEALIIRLVQSSDAPIAAFCASPREPGSFDAYQLDYMIASRAWGGRLPSKLKLPKDSVVRQCTAIGYSARGVEAWSSKTGPMEVEAVGIPPYPGGAVPRVVGFLKLQGDERVRSESHQIGVVFGDATDPRGDGQRLIVHVVNDKTPNWGGGGFASALRRAWPTAQQDFQDWADRHRASYRLGAVRIVRLDKQTSVASIVAQHGFGESAAPRVRYAALRKGLATVARLARENNATVHMPRIGTGQAGGSWDVVRQLIMETLTAEQVPVTVYDLPGQAPRREPQASLDFSRGITDT